MRISESYSYKNAKGILFENEILDEINLAFSLPKVKFYKGSSTVIREDIADNFNSSGWADKVKIKSQNNLRISFMKKNVGVCVQFGNVSRTYADLMKIMYLGKVKKIEVGVIAVPGKIEAKILGQNLANFERLIREINIFSELIEIPILALCITN